MLIRYDEDADAVYISLRSDDRIVSRTETVDAGTLIDLDMHGDPIGIEIVQPARRWPIDKVVEQFGLDPHTADTLKSFFAEDRPYPFLKPPASLVN